MTVQNFSTGHFRNVVASKVESSLDVLCELVRIPSVSWDGFDPATVGQSYDSAQDIQTGKVGVVHPQTQEMILNELTPIDCIFEAQREFPFARNFMSSSEANQEKMASIFYSIYTANMLKRRHELKNNFMLVSLSIIANIALCVFSVKNNIM